MDITCNIDQTQIYTLIELQDNYPGGIIQAIGALPILNSLGDLDSKWLEQTINMLYKNKVLPNLVVPSIGILPTLQSRPIPPPPAAPVDNTDLGCWKDSGDRAIKGWTSRGQDKGSCSANARTRGYKYYAIQDGDECYAGNNEDFKRYGKSEGACSPGGSSWINHVWVNTPCGTSGKPSPDNNIRLYTKEECDELNGNFAGNGECLKRGGGSWSWECRGLNFKSSDNMENQETMNYEKALTTYNNTLQNITDTKEKYNDSVARYNQKNDDFKAVMKTEYCFYENRLKYTERTFFTSTSNPEVSPNNKMVNYKNSIIEKIKIKQLILIQITSQVYKNNIALIEKFEGNMSRSSADLNGQHNTLTNELTASKLNKRMVDYTIEKNKANQNLLTLFGVLNVVAIGIIYGIASS